MNIIDELELLLLKWDARVKLEEELAREGSFTSAGIAVGFSECARDLRAQLRAAAPPVAEVTNKIGPKCPVCFHVHEYDSKGSSEMLISFWNRRVAVPDAGGALAFETLNKIRSMGWSVAVHNDYRLGGEQFTFWLFTENNGHRWIKGEARTDLEALQFVLSEIVASPVRVEDAQVRERTEYMAEELNFIRELLRGAQIEIDDEDSVSNGVSVLVACDKQDREFSEREIDSLRAQLEEKRSTIETYKTMLDAKQDAISALHAAQRAAPLTDAAHAYVWAGANPFTGEQVLDLLNENDRLRKLPDAARAVVEAAAIAWVSLLSARPGIGDKITIEWSSCDKNLVDAVDALAALPPQERDEGETK